MSDLVRSLEKLLAVVPTKCRYWHEHQEAHNDDIACHECPALVEARSAAEDALDWIPWLQWVDDGAGEATAAVGRWMLTARDAGSWWVCADGCELNDYPEDGDLSTAKLAAENALCDLGVLFRTYLPAERRG